MAQETIQAGLKKVYKQKCTSYTILSGVSRTISKFQLPPSRFIKTPDKQKQHDKKAPTMLLQFIMNYIVLN